MSRRTVALVLVLDLDDADTDARGGNAAVADRVRRAAEAATGPASRVPYVEAHDDLAAVLDPGTAARYARTERP